MLRTIQSEDAVHCLTKVTAPVFMIRSVNCDKSQSSSQWVRGKYAKIYLVSNESTAPYKTHISSP